MDAEEDDMAALGGDLTTGEKVGTLTELIRLAENLFESCPEGV